MKVGLAQLNPKIGDFAANTRKVLDRLEEARRRGVALLVFPELTLTGYPPRDLVDYPVFVDANLAALAEVARAARGITVICGFVERNPAQSGKPYFNSAAVLQDGKVVSTYRKQLLPYYDVFDEERYFEPGRQSCVFTVEKRRVALTICEDAWNIDSFLERPYSVRPLEQLSREKPEVLVNISASPFQLGKPERRIELFRRGSAPLAVPTLFCNQVGGNDELLFDGCSFALSASGELLARAPAFAEALTVAELDSSPDEVSPWPASEPEWIFNALKTGLCDYVRKCGARRICLGLSGGIDSSVAAAVAAAAVGPENVRALGLPTRFTSSPSLEDADATARNLGIGYRVVPIEKIFEQYETLLKAWFPGGPRSVTLENVQPRIRMTLLMALCNEEDCLLLNTSNKSEIATGYATQYGDATGALSILGDLTKAQVYALGRWINGVRSVIPERVFTRPPTAELKENQTDQDTLPPYDDLDTLVRQVVVRAKSSAELAAADPRWAAIFSRLHQASEYKRRQLPPVLRISDRAFGMGRRMPIAAKLPF